MGNCKAITNNKEQCKNKALPFSLYCKVHQDPNSWITGTIVGIIVAVTIAYFQYREPDLKVRCFLNESGDPAILNCEIINSGRKYASNVILYFNNYLPLETKIIANPELGIKLEATENIIHPQENAELIKVTNAFFIKVPRVPANETIKFTIITQHDDNLRAAKQVKRIRNVINEVLERFYKKLQEKYPYRIQSFNFDKMVSEQIKRDNFYSPSKFTYEKGSFSIIYIDEKEKIAAAKNIDLFIMYKKEFSDVLHVDRRFKSPVLRIRTSSGDSTYARSPPYVLWSVEFDYPIPKLNKDCTKIIRKSPSVPESYD